MTLMRQLEAPLTPLPNPLLTWKRHDGVSTSSEEIDSDQHQDHPPDDPPDASGTSTEPPVSVQQRVVHIELVSKWGNGPPPSDHAAQPPPPPAPPAPTVITQPRMADGGPVPKLKPAPTSRSTRSPPRPFFPKHYSSGEDEAPQHPVGSVSTKAPPSNWEESMVKAAMQAREVIQTIRQCKNS
eukprot:4975415-Amphidinium_carterae.2